MGRERIYHNMLEAVALRLKELRDNKGVSQETVYFDTHINLGRIELGKSNISLTTVAILCEYYGLTLEEFFKGIKTQ